MNETTKNNDIEIWKSTFDKKFGWLTNEETNNAVIDYSEKLLKKIYHHEEDSGAIFCLIVGAMGGAKTAATLSCLERSLNYFPNEKSFFNECFYTPLQCTKLGKNRYNLMAESEDIMFFDRNKKKQIFPEVTYFDSLRDCYEKAVLGKANVLFFKDRLRIIEFLGFLRTTGEWTHVFLDEISECFPSFTKSEDWRRIEKASFIMKDIRKTLTDVFGNTQNINDIDPRVVSKIMCKILLPGVRPPKNSVVSKKAINNLREDHVHGNEGYLEFAGNFCKLRFNKIYRPNPDLMIDARIVGEYE